MTECGGLVQQLAVRRAAVQSGKDTVSVALTTSERRFKPYLNASCAGYPDLHGSGGAEVFGNEAR